MISTHDAELALESRESRALLLRSCVFDGQAPGRGRPTNWRRKPPRTTG